MFGRWREPDMHALQTSLFLQRLHKFASTEKGTTPWLMTGDFNMYPYYPTYELVANGKVSAEGLDKLNPFKYKYPQIIEKRTVR